MLSETDLSGTQQQEAESQPAVLSQVCFDDSRSYATRNLYAVLGVNMKWLYYLQVVLGPYRKLRQRHLGPDSFGRSQGDFLPESLKLTRGVAAARCCSDVESLECNVFSLNLFRSFETNRNTHLVHPLIQLFYPFTIGRMRTHEVGTDRSSETPRGFRLTHALPLIPTMHQQRFLHASPTGPAY